jgi:hypothetical protein
MSDAPDAPAYLRPGYVDPALADYIRKFRQYQRWLDGRGELTKDVAMIREMMNRDMPRFRIKDATNKD